jgi:hypothetical protein
VIKNHTTTNGLTSVTIPNVIYGALPRQAIFYMLEESANRSFLKNPYQLKHFDLENIQIRVNGKQYPTDPYKLNFTTGQGVNRLLRDLYDNVGVNHEDRGLAITRDLLVGGSFLVAFDLTPDRCNGIHHHVHKTGTMDLELTFAKPLEAPIVVCGLFTHDATLIIDPNKECKVIF